MKPNILFIVIDGLRNDKVYGSDKHSLTPNLDLLLSSGTYFSQAISSSDGTRTCLGSIFTAQYSFQSGLNTFYNHNKSTMFFDFLKSKGYNSAATVPDVDFWKTLTKNFDSKILIPKPYEFLFGGTGEKILNQLDKLSELQPWINYIHLMDLHKSVDYVLPENFKDEKFGNNDYERMISGIDFWLGKILEKIDIKKTLIIITSDHGDFIPVSDIDHEITYIPSLVKFGQQIKKITPKKYHSSGESTFIKIRDFLIPIRKQLLKEKLSNEQLRTLNVRGTKHGWELFDEAVRIPLLFCGYNTPSNSIITNQVRQIDIFPTILSLIGLPSIVDNIEGESLFPLMKGEKFTEKPALIENQLLDPNDTDIVIGIRTSQYKYFRSINDKNTKLRLFDLKNDPTEQNNIANNKPEIINQMENLLSKLRTVSNSTEDNVQDDYEQEIKDELVKMGYME